VDPRQARVPWHRSLFLRLFGIAALIAIVAVAAATWATVRSTTVAVRDEQQESLHSDARTYDALIGYAATHRSWTGATDLVSRLARESGERIVIADANGVTLLDSEGETGKHPRNRARAELDPLDIDTALVAVSESEQEPVSEAQAVPCDSGGTSSCGRHVVQATSAVDRRVKGPFQGRTRQPWVDLQRRIDRCLAQEGIAPVLAVTESFAALTRQPDRDGRVAGCVDQSRRAMLTPYVAPPALLYVTGDGGSADALLDLSGRNQTRIALLAGAVLLVTLLLCALLAGSIVRPLRRMAVAAQQAADGDLTARVPRRRHDEIGEVAVAFNRMADRRQALEDARRRMVSDVSHELRAPLANVRGWVEAAQDGVVALDEQLLTSLHEESLHLQRLVDDLHDLSVGDAGELRLEPEEIDLAAFLDQVADAFRVAAEARGVTITADATEDATVSADPVRLRQAMVNLVANAIRHTDAGGHITLRGRASVIEVIDDGEGIPADELPYVFERFRRVDPSRSRATGGSGLGLAIVKQIAEAHGGRVSAASTPGAGTTVTMRLDGGS